jgi:hypothetical protein
VLVTDLPGQTLISSMYSGALDVSALDQGLYIIRISDSNGNLVAARKLIISR